MCLASLIFTIVMLCFNASFAQNADQVANDFRHVSTYCGAISPKSITHNGRGILFAQNMMYRHNITVFNRDLKVIGTIPDQVSSELLGLTIDGKHLLGSPVECTFTHYGKVAWVSNYQMYGKGFDRPGCDKCDGSDFDHSYVYKIDVESMKIMNAVQVGSVPKYVQSTPNGRFIIVSNWSSGDISVIDANRNNEIRRIKIGRFPRGLTINSEGDRVYIAVMGSRDIAILNLNSFELGWIRNVGASPRHLCISDDDNFLFATLNGEGNVVKIDLRNNMRFKVYTGSMPRSMALTPDSKYLYVVNYGDDTVSKVETSNMTLESKLPTKAKPIGITIDSDDGKLYVCCYSGCIMKFSDSGLTMSKSQRIQYVGGVISDYLDGFKSFRQEDIYLMIDELMN